jgi:hypothetical protein
MSAKSAGGEVVTSYFPTRRSDGAKDARGATSATPPTPCPASASTISSSLWARTFELSLVSPTMGRWRRDLHPSKIHGGHVLRVGGASDAPPRLRVGKACSLLFLLCSMAFLACRQVLYLRLPLPLLLCLDGGICRKGKRQGSRGPTPAKTQSIVTTGKNRGSKRRRGRKYSPNYLQHLLTKDRENLHPWRTPTITSWRPWPEFRSRCHTRILGAPNTGANFTKCVLGSSLTHMMTHGTETNVTSLIYNGILYKIVK